MKALQQNQGLVVGAKVVNDLPASIDGFYYILTCHNFFTFPALLHKFARTVYMLWKLNMVIKLAYQILWILTTMMPKGPFTHACIKLGWSPLYIGQIAKDCASCQVLQIHIGEIVLWNGTLALTKRLIHVLLSNCYIASTCGELTLMTP